LRRTILTFAGSVSLAARSETFATKSAVSPTAATTTATTTAAPLELSAPLALRVLVAVAPLTIAATRGAIARTLVAEVARVSLGPFATVRTGVVLRRISATRSGPLFTSCISASTTTPERAPLATAAIPFLTFGTTLAVRPLLALTIARPLRRNVRIEVERFPLEPFPIVRVLVPNRCFRLSRFARTAARRPPHPTRSFFIARLCTWFCPSRFAGRRSGRFFATAAALRRLNFQRVEQPFSERRLFARFLAATLRTRPL
jgi:hypothetical protein